MNYWRQKIYFACKYLLLILFVGYYSGITLFYHAHLVNGRIIVHSHPYKHDTSSKTPYESHQHSTNSYVLLDHLNKIASEEAVIPGLLPVPDVAIFECGISPYYFRPSVFDGVFVQLRAPPYTFS